MAVWRGQNNIPETIAKQESAVIFEKLNFSSGNLSDKFFGGSDLVRNIIEGAVKNIWELQTERTADFPCPLKVIDSIRQRTKKYKCAEFSNLLQVLSDISWEH